MEKEDGIVLKKGDSFFDKNLSSGIHTLFETLGHTNIINLMKGVRKNIDLSLIISDYLRYMSIASEKCRFTQISKCCR